MPEGLGAMYMSWEPLAMKTPCLQLQSISKSPLLNPLTLPIPISPETKNRCPIGTISRNYRRNPKPELSEPKTSVEVQPMSKNPDLTVDKREDKET